MEDRRASSGSGVSSTPEGDDVRGEELARHELADPGEYRIAADETEAEELTDPAAGEDVGVDDPAQLEEAETLAQRMRSSRPARKSADVAKKDAPTPVRRKRSGVAVEKRTTPAQFVGQSVDELKKVVWPTVQQVRQYFAVVLVFVLFIMAYVVALDTSFGAALLKLLG